MRLFEASLGNRAKELEDATSGATLERQFAQLESSGAGADAMLEDLKRKMLTQVVV